MKVPPRSLPVGASLPGSVFVRDYCESCGEPIRVTKERADLGEQCDECAGFEQYHGEPEGGDDENP